MDKQSFGNNYDDRQTCSCCLLNMYTHGNQNQLFKSRSWYYDWILSLFQWLNTWHQFCLGSIGCISLHFSRNQWIRCVDSKLMHRIQVKIHGYKRWNSIIPHWIWWIWSNFRLFCYQWCNRLLPTQVLTNRCWVSSQTRL